MKLDGPQFKLLRTAIQETYNYAALEIALREIGRVLRDTAHHSSGMLEVASAVIKTAEMDLWLVQLVEKVCKDKHGYAGLDQLYHEVVDPRPGETDDPHDTYLLHGHRAFVNRQNLRSLVKKLEDPLQDRILWVTGKGKWQGITYSKEYIYYVSERLSRADQVSFEPIWINLSREPDELSDGDLEPTTALEIAEDIIEQLPGLEMSQKLEDKFKTEQKARWVKRFCHHLKSGLTDSETVYWLILDGFDACVLGEGARELIEELADRVSNTLIKVRLVLLGYSGSLTRFEKKVLTDPLLDVAAGARGQQEVLEFITFLYEQTRQGRLNERAVAGTVAEIWSGIDQQDPRRLELLGDALTRKAREML